MTEEEIASNIQEKEEKTPPSVPQPEEENDSSAIAPVTSKKFLEALNTVQSYLLQQVGSNDLLRKLLGIKSFVKDTAINRWRQKTINDISKKNEKSFTASLKVY
ncbi:hypothetical protein PoB_001383600 [Plakobranchus ocellatus]|uniref:Uncharacterized protein n=1 Tax=Plakobranchus ocellatus TaxID=259542 RepID=A0AAV3YV68_9GAST|nr:hypothetical protein PoB_001383600 [Plakobranchus ocellatus]